MFSALKYFHIFYTFEIDFNRILFYNNLKSFSDSLKSLIELFAALSILRHTELLCLVNQKCLTNQRPLSQQPRIFKPIQITKYV